ncbi:MAG: hypothetical protein ACRCSW_19680 [Tabrizicola sp.]
MELNAEYINSALLDLTRRAGIAEAPLPVFTLDAPLPAATVATKSGELRTSEAGAEVQALLPDDGQGELRISEPDPQVLARVRPPGGGPGEKLVVMAVIDDGIPFAHRNFLNEAGDSTRIDYCWLQSIDATNPPPVIGREFTRTDINALIATHGPDEDALYRRSGALEDTSDYSATLGHFASHGAHVLDAAAGKRPDEPDLDRMRIIAVQLPAPVTIDTTGYYKKGPVLAAMHYIFMRADDIARAYLGDANAPLPLVINFSYGITGGPHDGEHEVELGMKELIDLRNKAGKPTTLVMPAGNSFANRMYGEITPADLATGKPFDIPWRIQPNDATTSYLELWIPASAGPAEYNLALAGPDGSAIKVANRPDLKFHVAPGTQRVWAQLFANNTQIGDIEIPKFGGTGLMLVRIALVPTEPRPASLPAAPAGLWKVSLTLTSGAKPDRPVSCRIQRDSDPYGYRRGGRQSYFDDPADMRYTSDGAPSRVENPDCAFVRRMGTLNGFATHDQVTVVSSYFADTGRATDYASAGPLYAPEGAPGIVDLSMAADASTALRGALAAGTRSGSAIRLSGTSMASPLYARRAAVELMTGVASSKVQPVLIPISEEEALHRPSRLGTPIAI